jgi:hypothetical protein
LHCEYGATIVNAVVPPTYPDFVNIGLCQKLSKPWTRQSIVDGRLNVQFDKNMEASDCFMKNLKV